MKTLVVVICVVLSVVNNVTSGTSDEADKLMAEMVDACKNKTGATDAEVKDLMDRNAATTTISKCLSACFLNKLGVMKAEKFVPDQLENLMDDNDANVKGTNGKTLKESLGDIANDCKGVSDPNECESADKILNCLDAATEKRGFGPNKF